MVHGRVLRCETQTTCLCLTQNDPETGAYIPGCFVRIEVGERGQGMRTYGGVDGSGKGTYLVGFVYHLLPLKPLAVMHAAPGMAPEIQHDVSPAESPLTSIAAVRIVGVMEQGKEGGVIHGMQPYTPAKGSLVEAMIDEEVRAFHYYPDQGSSGAYLHLGYVPFVLMERNPLVLQGALRACAYLERCFPANRRLLAIVTHSIAAKLPDDRNV